MVKVLCGISGSTQEIGFSLSVVLPRLRRWLEQASLSGQPVRELGSRDALVAALTCSLREVAAVSTCFVLRFDKAFWDCANIL